jgi:hypothetical protein
MFFYRKKQMRYQFSFYLCSGESVSVRKKQEADGSTLVNPF